MTFPRLFQVRQQFQGPRVVDVAATVEEELTRLGLASAILAGQRVAITAGSRGIANIAEIIRAIAAHCKSLGAEPFVVPAMGSHGGATAEGQLRVLASYGITEASCGCPLEASMETVCVCKSPEGVDVHFDKLAYEADHVIVCGRIKAHTSFQGEVQSGLMKMLLIGLGKHQGASIYHRAFRDFSFDQIVRSVASTVIRECRIVAGLAIVENGYEQTAHLEAVMPEDFVTREPELLEMANTWMARLPFRQADLLIVDAFGKNISGTGMDTNVIGRKTDVNQAQADEWPKISKILARSLTPETHGNATGIGLADLVTKQVIDQVDLEATRINCVTSGRTQSGMLPLQFETERAAVEAALGMLGLRPPQEAQIMWIKNTLELASVWCSDAYRAEVEGEHLQASDTDVPMEFDARGKLVAPAL